MTSDDELRAAVGVRLTYEAVGSGQRAPLVQPVWVGSIGQRLALPGQRGAVVLRHGRHPRPQRRPRQSPPLHQRQGGSKTATDSHSCHPSSPNATQGLRAISRGGWRGAGGRHAGAGEHGGQRFGLGEDGRVVGAALGGSQGDAGGRDGPGGATTGRLAPGGEGGHPA